MRWHALSEQTGVADLKRHYTRYERTSEDDAVELAAAISNGQGGCS
jgi:hypothetical protein